MIIVMIVKGNVGPSVKNVRILFVKIVGFNVKDKFILIMCVLIV